MHPGFIDLQVNGYIGVDFSDTATSEEDFIKASRGVLKSGTAAFLPTIITSLDEVYSRNLPILAKVMNEPEFKNRVMGFHLEGPFISPEKGAIGAHNPQAVGTPDCSRLDRMMDWADGKIKMLTIAAELPGAEELCKYATGLGITVSLGHQLATGDDLKRLSDAGAKSLTHLGNGTPNMLPRHPNTIWEGLANDNLTAMIISDGHHLMSATVKTMIRAKGIERIVVTSDSSSIAGMPPGDYHGLGNPIRLEKNGKLWNPEKSCLVGSSAMMIDCINYLHSLNLLGENELRQVGFDNPLKLIGINPAETDFTEILDFSPERGFYIA